MRYTAVTMSDSVAILEEMRTKLEAKRSRLRNQLAAVETEFHEIDTALRVLHRIAGDATPTGSSSPTSDNGATILNFVGLGEDEAKAPKEIFEALCLAGHDLNADLVRTQLWRMAKRGLIESENGKYWRAKDDDFSSLLRDDDHPDAPATLSDFEGSPQAIVAAKGGFMHVDPDDFDDDVPF